MIKLTRTSKVRELNIYKLKIKTKLINTNYNLKLILLFHKFKLKRLNNSYF